MIISIKRTNPFQGGEDDESSLGQLQDPSFSPGPSPSKGLITRSMTKKIQQGLDPHKPNRLNGLHMLFSWAKEDVKI